MRLLASIVRLRSSRLAPARSWRWWALRRSLLALPLIGIAGFAAAQVPPGAEAGRERERFIERQPARAQPGGPPISLPSTTAPAGAKTTIVLIRAIRVVGSTVYRDAELSELYADLIGRRVALQAVYDLAQRITSKYGADGYVLSRAVVPVQEIDPAGAAIRLEIVEGYIDRVVWPQKLTRYRDFFTVYGQRITADRPINIRTLERYLLLANDLPGLKFSTTLRASKTNVGASTLIVGVEEKPVDFVARLDNRGTEARGPWQFLLSPTINNLMGRHEALTLSYAAATTARELQYIAANYRQVLTAEGLTFFANGSYSFGHPGTRVLRELEFHTRSTYAEAGLQYPVIRSRERNLNVVALAFMGENYSLWNLTPGEPQAKDRLRGIRLRMEGDYAEPGGAINQYSATVSQGFAGFGSTENDNPLASRIGGQVSFGKLDGVVSRLQPLAERFSALISLYGQYALDPLLVPEQCGYGGRVFGRAYDPSELLGDHCWIASGELRYDVPGWGPSKDAKEKKGELTARPNLQLYGFTDKGKLYRLSTGSVGTDAATFTGASAGGGIRVGWQNNVNVDLSAAKAIQGPRNGWRFFFIAAARY